MLMRPPDPLREARDRKWTVTVTVPRWLAVKNDLLSRTMEGTLESVTEKAVLFKGSAIIKESRFCHRCGREITHPASLCVGYGPECSAKLGILWPDGLLTEEEIARIRETIRRQTEVEIWLPRSRTEIEVQRNEEECKTPTAQGSAGQCESNDNAQQEDARPHKLDTRQQQCEMKLQQPQAKFEVRGSKIAVTCAFGLKDRCKTVPGYAWDAQNKVWSFPASGTAAQGLVNAFAGVAVVKDNAFNKLLQDEVKTSQAQATKTRDDLPDVPNSKTKAWGHQKQAFWFATELWGGLPQD